MTTHIAITTGQPYKSKFKIRYVAKYKNPGGIYEEQFDDLEKLKKVIRCYDVIEIYKEKYKREVIRL